MYTTDIEKIESLYLKMQERGISDEIITIVKTTIQENPIGAYGACITTEGYAAVWQRLGVDNLIYDISEKIGITWTHTPYRN